MALPQIGTIRKWFTIAVGLLLIGSLVAWYVTRDRVPPTIRIAAGTEGGLYYDVAQKLATILEKQTGNEVQVIATRGSHDNLSLLRADSVELAILQGDMAHEDSAVSIAPLFPEIVHLIVRRDRGIASIVDLKGRSIALGPVGSGMRRTSLKVLQHYSLSPEEGEDSTTSDQYFTDLLTDETLDAAFVTAGIDNADLKRLLATKQFDVLPIGDARAVEMKSSFFKYFDLPRGLYAEDPAVPGQDTPTLATTAFLVGRDDISERLVLQTLGALYEDNLYSEFATLLSRSEAAKWIHGRVHSAARRYFIPTDNIGLMANVMESLVATKELLVALGAGIYLLWARWRRLQAEEKRQQVIAEKEHLDSFMARVLRVESAQRNMTDREQLEKFLDEVTDIKLTALRELTEEELRSDQAFEIFLIQCSNVINVIQLKLIAMQGGD